MRAKYFYSIQNASTMEYIIQDTEFLVDAIKMAKNKGFKVNVSIQTIMSDFVKHDTNAVSRDGIIFSRVLVDSAITPRMTALRDFIKRSGVSQRDVSRMVSDKFESQMSKFMNGKSGLSQKTYGVILKGLSKHFKKPVKELFNEVVPSE